MSEPTQVKVHIGECPYCKHDALLYAVGIHKVTKVVVRACYACRTVIKQRMRDQRA